MKTIYLDYAAATPVDPAVLAAMQPYFSERFYNASASYLVGRAVANEITKARQTVAKWLGARPSEIVFTAGGTEANNMAVHGMMQAHPKSNLIVSAIEHDSVLKPAERYRCKVAKVSPSGIVDINDLAKKIDKNTVLVSIMYANNEIGTVQPISAIAKLLQDIKHQRQAEGNQTPLYFHTDACQAPCYLDLHASRLGVDLMTINGGKIYGPKQSGVLYVKAGTVIEPLILGGGQERGLRSGTLNTPAIIGLAKALDLVQSRRRSESARLSSLQQLFYKLLAREIPQAIINGAIKHRLPNNIHLTIPGQDNETLMMQLDEKGVICATGSACSAASNEPSHVLRAIGLDDNSARASLRISMGLGTRSADIQKVVTLLKSLV